MTKKNEKRKNLNTPLFTEDNSKSIVSEKLEVYALISCFQV